MRLMWFPFGRDLDEPNDDCRTFFWRASVLTRVVVE